jgi:hypothetical protein
LAGRATGWEAPDDLQSRLEKIEHIMKHKHEEINNDAHHHHRHHRRRRHAQRSDSSSESNATALALGSKKQKQPRKKTVVIYAHCYCGTDRTGELMGSWDLWYNHHSWAEVNERNRRIGGRPMACKNYRAMQWWCLYVQGQRPEESI